MRVPAALARSRFPAPVLQVLRTLSRAGFRSFLVGGAVRDPLLRRRRPSRDFDVATPARPEEVERLFPRVIPTGVEHGTVTVVARGIPVEITTFRGEGPYRDGRRPESVTFLTDLESDLARRDFTINALAYDPLGREFRDPFGGRKDMRLRRIRAVGDPEARFAEDGLRPLRAVRFVAQLGFELAPSTRRAIPGSLNVVRRVAAERLTDEFSKLLVAPFAALGLRLLRKTGLLGVVLPGLASASGRALDHAIAVLAASPPVLSLRLSALFHGLGPAGAADALAALRLSRQESEAALSLVRAFPCRRLGQAALPAPTPAAIRHWMARVDPQRTGALLSLAEAEVSAVSEARRAEAAAEVRRLKARVRAVKRRAPPLSVRDLALDGRAVAQELGVGPGPRVGEALRHLLDRVLERPEENEPERLRAALREWSATPPPRL